MNPDAPREPREELEIRITALLMGQLPPAEAAELEARIAADPELVALHARLRHAAELLRESRALPEPVATAAPLRFSKERREKLLATFRGIKPLPSPPMAASPKSIAVPRLERKWVPRLVLAASIAVLLGGSVIYLARPEKAAREAAGYSSKGMSDPRGERSSHSLADRRFNVEMVRSNPAERVAFDESGRGRTTIAGLSPETQARATHWATQPGAVRTFPDGQPSKPEWRMYPENDMQAAPSSTASASNLGSGQVVPSLRSPAADPDFVPMPKMGGIYLPSGTAAPSTPEPLPFAFESEKQLAGESPPSNFGGTRADAPASYGLEISGGVRGVEREIARRAPRFGERDGAEKTVEDSVAQRKRSEDGFSTASRGEVKEDLSKLSIIDGENAEARETEGERRVREVVRNASSDYYLDRAFIPDSAAPGLAEAKDPLSDSAKEKTVEQLFADAKNYKELGRLEMAGRKYEEILNKDPNNIAARKGREDIYVRKSEVADNAYSAARAQAMWEMTSNWERPYRRFDRRAVEIRGDGKSSDSEATPEAGLALQGVPQLSPPVTQAEGAFWDTADALALTGPVEVEGFLNYGTPLAVTNPQALAGAPKRDGSLDAGISAHLGDQLTLSGPVPPGGTAATGKAVSKFREAAGDIANETALADLPQLRETPAKPGAAPKAETAQEALGNALLAIRKPGEHAMSSDPYNVLKDSRNTAEALERVKEQWPSNAASGAKSGIDPAQEAFVKAFLEARKAEEQTAAGDTQKALETYRRAAETLEKVKQQWSQWQPELLDYRLKRTKSAISKLESDLEAAKEKAIKDAKPAPAAEPAAPVKAPEPPPVPQPEVSTKDNAFSTFSLNVSDVSFQLASASLEKGAMPEPATVRSEEFINALNYRDPEPAAGAPFAFASERARYPFAHNRDLLRLSLKTAAAGREPGRPLNLVLLIDNSGSMERADRVRILKEALRVLTQQLKPQDKLSLITFSRAPRLWADGIAGDKAAEATQRVGEITPQGGTDLSAAIDLGYKTALKHYGAGSVNRVVLLTDGAANLGEVKPETLKETVEAHRKQGVAFDCFGVGWEGYNDDLLEQLSRNGDGRYGFINTPEAAVTEFAGQLAGALRVAASDVKVQVEFNPKRVLSYRQIGYAKHQLTKEQFRDNTVDAAEIGAAESGNALYVIEVNPRGEGDIGVARARFKVPGTSEYREHDWTIPFNAPAPAMEQASSSLRLATTAAAFSEWLAQSPYAAEVTTDRLLGLINGIPAIYGADPRPAKLESMIRQAKSISGR